MTVVMAVTEIAANRRRRAIPIPASEVSYMLAGEAEFNIEGQGHQAGEGRARASVSNPGVKHSVKNGPATTRILAIYTIPKGRSLGHARSGVTQSRTLGPL